MFIYKEQPLTDFLPKPQEGIVYEFNYGSPLVHYKTGDKFSEEQDAMIMKIPKQDMVAAYEKAGLQKPKSKSALSCKCWFQCRICGKLAYGSLHNLKISPRYNPCGCWSLKQKSEIGKKTGPLNAHHLAEYARSEKGRATSSKNGKLYGSKNVEALRQWHRDNPERSFEISSRTGKRTIQYAIEGAKKWKEEHPEETRENAHAAQQASLKWQKEHPEEWKKVWQANIAKAIAANKGTHPSKGEQLLKDILENKNIDFIQEYEMEGLLGKYGKPRRLDFYFELYNYKIAIEVDGEQHDNPNHFFNQRRYDGDSLQRIDAEKEEWCRQHDVTLFRFKYKDMKIFESKVDAIIEQFKNLMSGKTK